MITFDVLKQAIKNCKTKIELDNLRLSILEFVPLGGTVDDFYKLQKLFRTQKIKISRGTS
jgi:hypothetical protein